MEMENWLCIFVAEISSNPDIIAPTPGARRFMAETQRIRVKPGELATLYVRERALDSTYTYAQPMAN